MSKLFTGLLGATLTMGAIYAVATTTAAAMEASFDATATTSYTRTLDFETASKRAALDHAQARAQCDATAPSKRYDCHARAEAKHQPKMRSYVERSER